MVSPVLASRVTGLWTCMCYQPWIFMILCRDSYHINIFVWGVHIGVHVNQCVCTCTHVEVRSQPWVPFSGVTHFCFETGSLLSLGLLSGLGSCVAPGIHLSPQHWDYK